jgi:hypothetical protein
LKLLPWNALCKILKNPLKLFVWLTHHGFFSRMKDERYLKLLYRGVTGRKLHLNPPVLYSEKIQWLKLHDKNSIYPVFCDKIAVRNFVRDCVGEEHLVDLYGVWDDPDEIDLSTLPEQFVLKCTHDSGSVIICKDKSTLDLEVAKRALRRWLSRDYSVQGREWPYKGLPRRIMAERYLVNADGSRAMDYKFFALTARCSSCSSAPTQTSNTSITSRSCAILQGFKSTSTSCRKRRIQWC